MTVGYGDIRKREWREKAARRGRKARTPPARTVALVVPKHRIALTRDAQNPAILLSRRSRKGAQRNALQKALTWQGTQARATDLSRGSMHGAVILTERLEERADFTDCPPVQKNDRSIREASRTSATPL